MAASRRPPRSPYPRGATGARRRPTARRPAALAAPGDLTLGAGADHPVGLSRAPDGRRVAFPATRGGITQIWLQDLTTGARRPLPDTEGAVLPFWSADARQLGFFKSGRLMAQSLDSGRTADLGATASAPRFLFNRPASGIATRPMTAVVNWRSLLLGSPGTGGSR